jgi:hypothetical protein
MRDDLSTLPDCEWKRNVEKELRERLALVLEYVEFDKKKELTSLWNKDQATADIIIEFLGDNRK